MVLSIITVNLNNKAGLLETIESVVTQNFVDYEYIVIDGGSIDGSLEVINKFSKQIAYWISEPDNGIYHAMNKGIAKAKGEWIIFMNSGDIFINNEVVKKVFTRDINLTTKIIYGNALFKGSNKIERPFPLSKSHFLFATICHQSLFVRSELFCHYGKFDLNYIIVSDKEWIMRIYLAKNHFSYINLDICLCDPVGFSSKNIELFVAETKKIEIQYFTSIEIFFFRLRKYLQRRLQFSPRSLLNKYTQQS